MAKVANRLNTRSQKSCGKTPVGTKGKKVETTVSITTGFKELRDMNRKALYSLKH